MKTGVTRTLIWFVWLTVPILAAKSGPFKSSYTRVGPCASPTQPVDIEPVTLFYAELYNTSKEANLLRGNITVVKEHKLMKMKAKSYVWVNNKWKVSYLVNNMSCNRVFFPVICMATGLKYNVKTCTFYKGIYLFEKMSVDKLQHSWMTSQEYGKILWRIELFSKTGTVFCYDFESICSNWRYFNDIRMKCFTAPCGLETERRRWDQFMKLLSTLSKVQTVKHRQRCNLASVF